MSDRDGLEYQLHVGSAGDRSVQQLCGPLARKVSLPLSGRGTWRSRRTRALFEVALGRAPVLIRQEPAAIRGRSDRALGPRRPRNWLTRCPLRGDIAIAKFHRLHQGNPALYSTPASPPYGGSRNQHKWVPAAFSPCLLPALPRPRGPGTCGVGALSSSGAGLLVSPTIIPQAANDPDANQPNAVTRFP